MKALVLGATGFIGGQIARAALEVGWSVRALRRRPNAVGALGDVADQVEWTPGSLSGATLPDVMRGCDVVFHAAAFYAERNKDVAGSVRRGVSEMRQVLGAFAESGAGRLIYTSSLTTVGLLPPTPNGWQTSATFFCRTAHAVLITNPSTRWRWKPIALLRKVWMWWFCAPRQCLGRAMSNRLRGKFC